MELFRITSAKNGGGKLHQVYFLPPLAMSPVDPVLQDLNMRVGDFFFFNLKKKKKKSNSLDFNQLLFV